jgi:hypothetical protein
MNGTQRLPDYSTYQPFSYTVTTTVSPEKFKDVVKVLIHPAGMRLITKYVIEEKKIQSITAKQAFL